MTRNRRAFVLIVALFMVTFISVIAFAFLSSGSLSYSTTLSASIEQQALALANSGLEDARVKLQHDPSFPPTLGDEGPFFSYSEEVRDLGGGAVIGSFDVTVDSRYVDSPYYLVRLTCTGRVARQSQETTRVVTAEIDVSPNDRRSGYTGNPNPNLYRVVNYREEGE